ncbi:hypothetical protein CP532_2115 [Ophiocordyceps camponoti-leonardi (nom. inval.)]|nr:hypothetical protein CP532_2115 [Ophiocordyceps camponoti-leonardi (nom. inval.)]
MDLHWTQDPDFSHLRTAPAWYHTSPEFLYTRRPSSIMEKQTMATRKANWQWEAVQGSRPSFMKSIFGACLWPCGSYARTSSRLRCALAGHNVESMPEPAFFNPDCAQFAACFPMYGCLLGRLQTTVRAFYGIEGSDYTDWAEGCFCPCVALVRNDREILVREKQHGKLRQLHDPKAKNQYQSQSPMSCDQMRTFGEGTRSPKGRKKGKDSLVPTSETTSKGTGNDAPLYLVPASQRPIGADADSSDGARAVPITAALMGRHSLTQDQMSAFVRPRPAHELATDVAVPGGVSESIHGLHRDAMTAQAKAASQHLLAEDRPIQSSGAPAPGAHQLGDDEVTAADGLPRKDHVLGADRAVAMARPDTPHGLVDDAPAKVGTDGGAHQLSNDATLKSANDGDGRHGLEADKAVATKGLTGRPHVL